MFPAADFRNEMDLCYFEPQTLEEALKLLHDMKDDAVLLAGGSDLMPRVKHGHISSRNIISLARVLGLQQIIMGATGEVLIGPMVTHRVLEGSSLVQEKYPILGEAASVIACRSIRNAGTIGGNICNASPAADLAPPLLVLDAGITVRSVDRKRVIPAIKFFKEPGKTVLEPGEMVTAIAVPPVPHGWGDCYMKLGTRNAMEISTVSVGTGLVVDQNGICKVARVALGAVGPVPLRAMKAEQFLEGKKLEMDGPEVVAAAQAAAGESRPITDMRATLDYRRQMVEVFTRRAINKALERAKEVLKS